MLVIGTVLMSDDYILLTEGRGNIGQILQRFLNFQP